MNRETPEGSFEEIASGGCHFSVTRSNQYCGRSCNHYGPVDVALPLINIVGCIPAERDYASHDSSHVILAILRAHVMGCVHLDTIRYLFVSVMGSLRE